MKRTSDYMLPALLCALIVTAGTFSVLSCGGQARAYAGALPEYDHNALDSLAKGDFHTQYLPVDGSRGMTGELTLFGNPTGDLSAVPRQYVDTRPVGDAATVAEFAPYTTVVAGGLVVRKSDGTIAGTAGGGTVTSVSVNTANGFSATVTNPGTTPVITIGTTPYGMLFSDGTGLSAAVPGTHYLEPSGDGSSLTGITAAQAGAVPVTRTVNGAALSGDVTVSDVNLSTSDVTANNVSASRHGFVPKAPNDASRYLDGTGSWSVPSSAASLPYVSGSLGEDVPIVSSNTFYDGPSVTLTAGTWLISGVVTVYYGGSASPNVTAKLWNGATVKSSTEVAVNVSYWRTFSLPLSAVVAVTGTETWKVSVAETAVSSSSIRATCPDNGAGNNASTIWAVRIAP